MKQNKIIIISSILLVLVGLGIMLSSDFVGESKSITNASTFSVKFTNLYINGISAVSNISSDGRSFTINPNETGITGEVSYQITNTSKTYNADININCKDTKNQESNWNVVTPQGITANKGSKLEDKIVLSKKSDLTADESTIRCTLNVSGVSRN